MKRVKHITLGCWALGALILAATACQEEQEDYFETPASQRLAQTISHASQVLRSAEHGWELEYYPSETFGYGGVVYTVKFDSLTATVGCSLIPDSTSTTYYRLTNDNGPVITFDTYNPLLHYFATPSSDEYQAKGGDFEFVIDSIGQDLITLFGKKTRNTMYLRRLTAAPDEYARNAINVYDHFVDSIRGEVGSMPFIAKTNPVVRSINVTTATDTFDVRYTYTDRGIRLYRPLTFGGVSVQSFDFDTEALTLTCTDEGRAGIVLQGVPYPDDFMSYARWEADYSLVYNNNASTANVHLTPNRLEGTYTMEGLAPAYTLVLRYAPATGDLKLGAQVIGQKDGSDIYWSCVNYNSSGSISNINITDEGQFTIHWNGNRFYPRCAITSTLGGSNLVNSAVLIYLYYTASGALSAGLLTDTEWLTNGSYLFPNLQWLNRKDRMLD